MFDLISGKVDRPLREPAPGATVISIVAHGIFVVFLIAVPLLTMTNKLPEVSTIVAFVVSPDTLNALPPPPPPPPSHKVLAEAPRAPSPKAAPVAAPSEIESQPAASTSASATAAAAAVEGGTEGVRGVEGGVSGGVVGGLVGELATPPPPPTTASAAETPVRVGGRLAAPALLHRVEPVYPDVGVATHIAGIVILEAVVGTDGCVETVQVLRSSHVLLDRAAVAALKQWRYSPLALNGVPTRFVLTVTFNFSTHP